MGINANNSQDNAKVIKGRIIPSVVLEKKSQMFNFPLDKIGKWLCSKLNSINCIQFLDKKSKLSKISSKSSENLNAKKEKFQKPEIIKLKKISNKKQDIKNSIATDDLDDDIYDSFGCFGPIFELDVNNNLKNTNSKNGILKKETENTKNLKKENSAKKSKSCTSVLKSHPPNKSVSFAILFGDLTQFEQDEKPLNITNSNCFLNQSFDEDGFTLDISDSFSDYESYEDENLKDKLTYSTVF